MFRSYLIAAGAALLCTTATAQQKLDPSRMFPITTPIKNAGTVDVTTGKWTKPNQSTKLGSQTVFNNTCSWTTQAYYAGFDWCEENYDEGRIPSPSDPNAPSGAEVNNNITSVQVSYCTFAGPLGAAGYDMDLAFFDNLGGNCVGTVPPTPVAGGIPAHPNLSAGGYLALGGLGLPGSTAIGFQACWLVTLNTSNAGLVIIGDSDGIYDGAAATDDFTWMQRQNTTVGALQQASPDGFFISGEPATGGFGACSYNIPCGVDAISGLTCGTGLDAFDNSWINVDGIGVGASNQPAGCINSVAQYGFGTNCYFFGGYPTNPFASYWLVLGSDGRGTVGTNYCAQSKATTVAGCTASIGITDNTLATGVWQTTNIPRAAGLGTGTVLGIYIYTNGVGIGQSAFSANVAFGTLCLAGFKRSSPACAPATLPGAAAGVCNTGFLSTAVNCNAGALGITVGQDVNAQLWYRDPGSVGDANFSDAIFYTVQ
jgi:hypothetical protein